VHEMLSNNAQVTSTPWLIESLKAPFDIEWRARRDRPLLRKGVLLHQESDGVKNNREPACCNVDW